MKEPVTLQEIAAILTSLTLGKLDLNSSTYLQLQQIVLSIHSARLLLQRVDDMVACKCIPIIKGNKVDFDYNISSELRDDLQKSLQLLIKSYE